MIQPLFVFNNEALLILRIVLGIILVAHGLPKIKDLKTTAQNFEGMGFKPGSLWGFVVAATEFIGGLALIAGIFTQIIALLVAIEFIVIILKLKRGQKLVGGYELDLLILAGAVLLAAHSGGSYSLDEYLGIVLY